MTIGTPSLGGASPPAGLLAREYLRRDNGLLTPDRRLYFPAGRKARLLAGIGTPTIVGSGYYGSWTTSAAVVAGNLLVVGIGLAFGTARTITSVSDGTNSYSLAAGMDLTNISCRAEIWYCANAKAVASGATVSVGISGGAPSYATGIAQVSGAKTTSPFDSTGAGGSNPASGSSESPSVTTGTLSSASEVIFGVTAAYGDATFTEASNFTNLFNLAIGGATGVTVGMGYQIAPTTSAVTYAPSLNASENWVAAAAPFIAAASPAPQMALQIKRVINIRR